MVNKLLVRPEFTEDGEDVVPDECVRPSVNPLVLDRGIKDGGNVKECDIFDMDTVA